MPQTEIPAPAESIAVLETRLFPGSESMIDCALFFGSSVGTLEARRNETMVEVDPKEWVQTPGRRREEPMCTG